MFGLALFRSFFFCKHKTADEMRISDWSSDVCSSDLFDGLVTPADLLSAIAGEFASDQDIGSEPFVVERDDGSLLIAGSMPADQTAEQIGRASCRERVCKYE